MRVQENGERNGREAMQHNGECDGRNDARCDSRYNVMQDEKVRARIPEHGLSANEYGTSGWMDGDMCKCLRG